MVEELDRILQQVQRLDRSLLGDLEETWRELEAIMDAQRKRSSLSVEPAAGREVSAYRSARRDAYERLFEETKAQWQRRRPYKRALSIVAVYEAGLQDLIRSAPAESIHSGGTQEFKDKFKVGGWRLRFTLLRKNRRIPLRASLEAALAERVAAWVDLEGEFFLTMANSLRLLRGVWEVRRCEIDARVLGSSGPLDERQALLKELPKPEVLRQRAAKTLGDMKEWSAATPAAVASTVIEARTPTPDAISALRAERERRRRHLLGQLRSIEVELELEQSLSEVEDRILELASQSLSEIQVERRTLLEELDAAIACCRGDRMPEALPTAKVELVPSTSRIHSFEQALEAASAALPRETELFARHTSAPRAIVRPHRLAPRATLSVVYHRRGRARIAAAFESVDSEHRRILREMERASEVVAFGQETGVKDADSGITREAVSNALSLMEYAREQSRDWAPQVSEALTVALAGMFDETRALLRRKALGAVLYLWGQGLRRAPGLLLHTGAESAIRGLRTLYGAAGQGAVWLLVRIGWRQEPAKREDEVTTRALLPAEFTVDLTTKDLPAIYRRLFTSAPVDDPRFLIGRDKELRALAEARKLWEQSRPVSIIVIGRRGSGKTSLINCALKEAWAGLGVIRGEISQRVVTEGELRDAIAALAGIGDSGKIEEFLLQERRIFILEELERTFLRQVGGYGAIRGLQRLIAATYSSTLWVVAVNQISYRFLNAAVALGESFSHRINAGAVGRDELQQAILLRHNLSGLRLEFPSPPAPANPADRLRLRLRGARDPETVFFDLLFRESGGAFRAAFDIWLGQIDRAAGGALYLKALQDIDLSPVVDGLDNRDIFTLMAVLEHGSLTPSEHARVFQMTETSSQAQIDQLAAREIVERDPRRPGFRIRPEAARVVQEVLYRRNLM